MTSQRQVLKTGALVILFAALVRLLCGSVPEQAAHFFGQPAVASAMLYLETGRILREIPPVPTETTPPAEVTEAEIAAPTEAEEQPAVAVFAPDDGTAAAMGGSCKYAPDTAALVQSPRTWDLTADGPAVLIVHTHATESYVNQEGYTESSAYRTLDENYNMLSVGDRLAEVLEQGGIQVIHDRSLHDHPSYTASYNNSRKSVAAYLEEYPSIRLVLDIHRDAVELPGGEQMGFSVSYGADTAARLMLVVGTDANGLTHPHWQDNLAFALQLYTQMEKICPGVDRPIDLRNERFNQDLGDAFLLVEVGAAGNTRQQALLGAEILAKGILSLAHGANHG